MASSDDLTEKEVKDFIKGILTSTPHVSTLQSLRRDYRELIGQTIPFQKFKYNSLEQFLKSSPDTCTVNGSGPFAQIYPVIDKKIAHINKLVTSQKINPKGRRKPVGRRPRFIAPVDTRNMSTSVNNANYVNNTVPFNKESQMRVSDNMSQPFVTKNVNINNAPSCSEVFIKREQNKVDCQLVKQKLDNVLENRLKSGGVGTGPYSSKSNIDNLNNSNNNQISEKLEKLYFIDNNEKVQLQPYKSGSRALGLSFDEDISNVPRGVQSSLKTLISLYEDGIWVSDLPGEYRKLFKRDLSFMDYGYTSLIEMCISLKHIFHYVRPGADDFKLYDRSKPLPPSVEKNYTIASYDVGKKITYDEALPELDWSDFRGYIPKDIFEYGNVIPNRFFLEGTAVDSVVDVAIVEIYDPSKFWFNFGSSDTRIELDDLMDELQTFYNDPANAKEYAIPPAALKEGLYCVQVILDEYHRARIVKVFPDCNEYVRVLYIDYGTVTKAPVQGMCFLHSNFATLPAQAIRGRLANIVPLEKGHPWRRSTSERFREMVSSRNTKIKVSYIDWKEEFVCVFLADVTDPKNIFYINEMLVKEGHALWDGEKQDCPFVMSKFKCKVRNIHLFPTFTELEYGFAPNAFEMYALAEMLVPLHLCIPQYFELNDEQVLSEEENLEEMENAFIETVKNHRRFTTLKQIDVGTLTANPTIDFNVFGSMKDEMVQFCDRFGLLEEDRPPDEREFSGCDNNVNCIEGNQAAAATDQIKKEDYPPGEEEFSGCDNKVNCVEGNQAAPPNIEDFQPVRMLREDRELTESIIQKLENCCVVDSETSTNLDSDYERDLLSPLVPQKSSPDYLDDYGKYLTVEEIVEQELSTIFEQSESNSDTSPPRIKLPDRALHLEHTESDINIFDNPEAFENAFSDSSSSSSPVSPLSFLKNVEIKFNTYKEIKESDCTALFSSSSTVNQGTENPFRSETSLSLGPSKSHFSVQTESDFNGAFCRDSDRNTLNICTTNNKRSEALYLGLEASPLENIFGERNENEKEDERPEDKIDLPFKSNIDDTRNAFVNSLSKTNPFRGYLNDELDLNIPADCSTDDSLINLKGDVEKDQNKPQSIKEIGVQTFEREETPLQTESTKASSTDMSCADSSPLRDKNVVQQISVNAVPFVPVNYSYPQWSNGGGYSVPHYPQWSDGNNYPAPYLTPYNLPNPRVRPPPGFTSPYQALQATSQSYNQLNPYYAMSRGNAPAFPQYRGPLGYFAPPRQIGPSTPGNESSFGVQNNDFYERFNEGLINRNNGQS